MGRLGVDVDPVAIMRNVFGEDVPDPVQMTVLAELGGAESISCHLREDLRSVSERDVRLMREIVKTHLNVRCPVREESVRLLQKIKPGMITFVSKAGSSLKPGPLFIDDHVDLLGNFVAELRANDISSSVYVATDINQIKLAGKLEFDYIELCCEKYAEAVDLDAQVAELENINSLALAANRLGMGTNVSGGLNQENLRDISKIPYFEDLIIGNALLVKSLAIGFEHAVRDFVNLI